MSKATEDAAPTVNPEEIERFKDMSSIWWDKEGVAKPLHTMNELRVPWVVDSMAEAGLITKEQAGSSKPLQGLKVLDVGCGAGILSEALVELGCTVVGIDPCAEIIQEAKKHQILNPNLTNLSYVCDTIEKHTETHPEEYDAIIASEVVDHVDEQEFFLELCCKCLRPGGAIFVTTFTQTWTSWFVAIIFYEYVWGVMPRGCHSWYKFITPEKVGSVLEKSGCQTKKVRGMHLNFPDKTWRWNDNVSVSYGLYAVKEKK